MNLRPGFSDIVSGWMLISGIDDLTDRIERASKWTKANGPLLPDEEATIKLMIEAQIARGLWPEGAPVDLAPDEELAEGISRLLSERDALAEEVSRLRAILNTPVNDNWLEGVRVEAAHQVERWAAEHDRNKSALDWFWLIGYLAQKAAWAALSGDREKAKHHTISTGAALLNWHRHIQGGTQQGERAS